MSELDLFYYTTHQWDKGTWAQDFVVDILWKDKQELYEILSKLGIKPETHDVIDQENTWQYSKVIPNFVQPGESMINGIKCWVELRGGGEENILEILVIDSHPHEDLNDYIFEQAKRLESYLKTTNLRFRRPEPDWDKRRIVSKETHPELWES